MSDNVGSKMLNTLSNCNWNTHICVLVSSDSYKLILWEGESLSSAFVAHVLHTILCHLHNVQPRLVFMKRLQDDHLQKRAVMSASHFSKQDVVHNLK